MINFDPALVLALRARFQIDPSASADDLLCDCLMLIECVIHQLDVATNQGADPGLFAAWHLARHALACANQAQRAITSNSPDPGP